MKLLLIGKNGQVGFELQRALVVLGEVTAVDQEECDLADEPCIRRLVRDVQPDIIVNAAAYTAVDKAEADKDLAFAVNARAPAILGEEAERLGALLVHYSTDYVFDGLKNGQYTEQDIPNPQSVYGASKHSGEIGVQRNTKQHIVLRTSWVLGSHGTNFAKTMLRLAADRDTLKVVADQYGAPTSAELIADITAHIIKTWQTAGKEGFPYGLYHLVASGSTNWHEYASYVIEYARKQGHPIKMAVGAIQAIPTSDYPTPAKRPGNSRLNTHKLQTTFGLSLPEWRHGVSHVLDQLG